MASSVSSSYGRTYSVTLKRTALIVFAAMTLFVVLTRDRTLLDPNSPLRQRYSVIPILMFLHGIPGAVGLFLGFVQFSNRIRQKYLELHRVLGRIYVGSVAVSAPAAIFVSLKLPTHNLTEAAFIQSLGWMVTTATALYCVRTKQIQQHREWMIRSYPFAMVFVVVRVILAIPRVAHAGVDGITATVWTVLTLACFLPSAMIEWQKLASKSIARRRSAAAD